MPLKPSFAALLGAAFLTLSQATPCAAAQDHPLKLSPFEAVRWEAEASDRPVPVVMVDGEWYRLHAIDGRAAGDVVAFSRRTFGDRWRKRFEEDLVELLERMGRTPPRFVALELEELDTGARVVRERVEMTEAKRTAVWAAARRRRLSEELRPVASLPRDAALRDLEQLDGALEHLYAYYPRSRAALQRSLAAARAQLPDTVTLGELALRVARVLAAAGDGHARLDGGDAYLAPGYLPFLVELAYEGPLAVRSDRGGFLDPDRPRLVALDGVEIERWIEAAARIEPQGAPHMLRRRSVRGLRHVQHLRAELGRPLSPSLRVQLAALDGGDAKELVLPVDERRPIYGQRLPDGHRLLDGDIGYLRIASMSTEPRDLEELDAALERFSGTRGLAIDVRGNGGGKRDALRHLLPYFMQPDEGPRVVNVAKYRLAPGEPEERPEGWLADRYLWPASSPHWNDEERAAIARFAQGFVPEWEPPREHFSDWHYMVVGRDANPRARPYGGPVVVLLDSDCFSATDVFLGAFAGRPGITLMGTPSGGGSGRARPLRLSKSGLALRLPSMASFRPDGRLYEGRGIEPDLFVEPAAADFIGRSDAALDAALQLLRRSRER